MAQMKSPLELVDLGGNRSRVSGITSEHLDRDRPAVAVAQQAIDDLRPIGPVIATVAVPRERAAPSFEIGGTDIVEHQGALAQMPLRELPLDPGLLRAQPIQCCINLPLLDHAQIEHLAEARCRALRIEAAQRREFRSRRNHPAHDQRHGKIALTRCRAPEQAGKVQLAHHPQHRRHVPVRQGALDLDRLIRTAYHRAAGQQGAQPIDQLRRHLAQIGNRALADLAPLADALPQENRRRRAPVRNHIDKHDAKESHPETSRKRCMDTKVRQKTRTLP